MIAGQFLRLVVQFGGMVVLARLLAPQIYGLFAIVLIVVTLGEVIRDLGLTMATIQTASVSPSLRSAIAVIQTGMGTVLTILVFLGAPGIASLVGEPGLVDPLRAVAPVFIINGICAQSRSDLNREARFGSIALTETTSQIFGTITAIAFAKSGQGIQALVLQQLVAATILAVWSLALARRPYASPRDAKRSVATLLRYGLSTVGGQLMSVASRTIPTLSVGITGNARQTGLFDRANQLVGIPLMQIQAPLTRVALPTLARARREDEVRFEKLLLRAQSNLMIPMIATFGLLGSLSSPLISIVYGEVWSRSAPILTILALSGAFQVAGYASYWAYMSVGAPAQAFKISLLTRGLTVAIVVTGALLGPAGAAAGVALGMMLSWLTETLYLKKVDPIVPVGAMLKSGARHLGVGATSAGVAVAVSHASPQNPLASLTISAGAYLLISGALLVATQQTRNELTTLIRDLRAMTTRSTR